MQLECKLRSELQRAATKLEAEGKLDAAALEQALSSRLGSLKWAEQNGLRLSGCTLNGFTLSAAIAPLAQSPPQAQVVNIASNEDFERELAHLQLEEKIALEALDHDLKQQSMRAKRAHENMEAELTLLQNASNGGLSNEVLIAYLSWRKSGGLQ